MAGRVRWALVFLGVISTFGLAERAPADGPAIPAAPTLPTYPMPFMGITPCRIVDTRDANRGSDYGPPALSAGVPRSFIIAGQCGIPIGAQAVSLNVTVVSPQGLGYVLLYPKGAGQPVVSTLNYLAGQTVANAAIVPLGDDGGLTVSAALSGTDLLIDTNGFFGATVVPDGNTALGPSTFFSLAAGAFDDTALGAGCLFDDSTGAGNTAIGYGALVNISTENYNTAVGYQALEFAHAGLNTALGTNAFLGTVTGSNNIGIGVFAGMDLTSGEDNIYIGTQNAPPSESAATRLGDFSLHASAFIAGVRGVSVGAGSVGVLVDSGSQLGTISSSERLKRDVEDIGEMSRALLALRPVTFRYRTQADERPQFGLIAEEVELVYPDLVVCDSDTGFETVLYHELPALLVNELQRQQKRIAELRGRIAELERRRRNP
jgi:hypothetical protein